LAKVDLILPEELANLVKDKLDALASKFCYYKVSMTLEQIISGDFFNHYIKLGMSFRIKASRPDVPGNIMMISQGQARIDNRYTLRDGTESLLNSVPWLKTI